MPIRAERCLGESAYEHNHHWYPWGDCGMPSNARHHPREQVTLRVDYMDGEGRSGLGLAKNLSYTGIAFTSLSRPLAVG